MPENSTNVRTPLKPAVGRHQPTAIRWLGRIARLSPAAAGRVAAHWFTQPRRWPRPERERLLLANATALTLRNGETAWSFGAGPLVVLVHGWEGRGAQLGSFVEPLVARGFRVVTFDVTAHGNSPGTHATVMHWLPPLFEISERFGEPLCVIGHSFGCPAISLALRRGYHARSAIYVAPPDALDGGVRAFARVTALGDRGRDALAAVLSRQTGIRFEDQRVKNFGRSMTTPLLVVHDSDDADVPLACAQTYARHWPGCRVFTTSGLGHRKVLHDPAVVTRVVTFVEAQRTDASALERWFDSALCRPAGTEAPPEAPEPSAPSEKLTSSQLALA